MAGIDGNQHIQGALDEARKNLKTLSKQLQDIELPPFTNLVECERAFRHLLDIEQATMYLSTQLGHFFLTLAVYNERREQQHTQESHRSEGGDTDEYASL